MSLKVAVWGTGNVGRPAVRAVLSHHQLTLAAVIVSDPAKVGRDAGEIAGVGGCGVIATDDWRAVLDCGLDALVYTASADTRPEAALEDLLACLRAGVNVVSSAFYAMLDPQCCPEELRAMVDAACRESGASLFVSGIDPGWVMDLLPVVVSGASADISEIRTREIFNYALYDQPSVVREVIGFGGPMDELPLMLHDFAIEMVWAPMLHLVGRALGEPVVATRVEVQRLPLDKTIEVPGMGTFEAGTQGAFRFELTGTTAGAVRYVLEHITRIDDACGPDWPRPPVGSGCHQVLVSGSPSLELSVHGHDPVETGPAGGGNASAAAWIVNAIPGVCAAGAGIATMLDLPPVNGSAQLRRAS